MHRAILFFIIFTSAWPLTLSAFTEQLNRQRRYCELVVMTGIGARLQDRAKVQNQDLNRLLNAARNTIQNRARTVTSALSSVDRQALTTAISSCKHWTKKEKRACIMKGSARKPLSERGL